MSPWDSIREYQRLLAAMDPLRDEIRRMREMRAQTLSNPLQDVVESFTQRQRMVHDAISLPLSIRDLAAEVLAARNALAHASTVLPDQALLEASFRPFLEVSRASAEFLLARQFVDRLSAGFDSASFVCDIDLAEGGDDTESAPAPADYVEEQLVALATPETLTALRDVGFAPILTLDQALRQPEAMLAMDPRSFEAFVAALVDKLGFDDVVLTPRAGDQGRDVLATKRIHGIPILFAFECKRFSPGNPVGVAVARALLGTIVHGRTRANKGVLVTTSRFTKGARSFIVTEPALDGRDYDGLVEWLRAVRPEGAA